MAGLAISGSVLIVSVDALASSHGGHVVIELKEEARIAEGAFKGGGVIDGHFEPGLFGAHVGAPVSSEHVAENSLMAFDCEAQCVCSWRQDSPDVDHHCVLAHVVADNQNSRPAEPSCALLGLRYRHLSEGHDLDVVAHGYLRDVDFQHKYTEICSVIFEGDRGFTHLGGGERLVVEQGQGIQVVPGHSNVGGVDGAFECEVAVDGDPIGGGDEFQQAVHHLADIFSSDQKANE